MQPDQRTRAAAVKYLRRTLSPEQRSAFAAVLARGERARLFQLAGRVVCEHLRRAGFDEAALDVPCLEGAWPGLVADAVAEREAWTV